MKKIAFTLVGLLASSAAFADILTLTPGKTVISGVNIASEASSSATGKPVTLVTVGAGLRSKMVITNLNVYVVDLMVADPSKFQTADPLAALEAQSSVAIRLNFLINVPGETIVESFQDAFDANKLSTADPDLAHFIQFASAAGDARKGKALNIVISKNVDGSETLAYENIGPDTRSTKLDVHTYAPGMTRKVLSIWLGTPADEGLATLKTQLLNGGKF